MGDQGFEDTNSTENKITRDQIEIPSVNTSIYQAIYRRRMSRQFVDDMVPKHVLERMLATAIWAPNHRLTEPWRFFIVEKGSLVRSQVATLAYQTIFHKTENEERATIVKKRILSTPVILFVYCVPGGNEKITRENYASVCCAIQNISLAGVAEGLTVYWETGGVTGHPDLGLTIGAEKEWSIVAMLSIGVASKLIESRRTRVQEFVRWLGTENSRP